MKIKICGLFRKEDIEYVNEARPDFIGFVFAQSKRQVSFQFAEQLRKSLNEKIIPVGVFVNHPIEEIADLYKNGIISVAQLHGNENAEYISRLKKMCASIQIIKTIQSSELEELHKNTEIKLATNFAIDFTDYILIDSGAGSGKTFNWEILEQDSVQHEQIQSLKKNWFLAGGINADNIEEAMSFNPFAIDISGGAETDGVKDREKILELVSIVRDCF